METIRDLRKRIRSVTSTGQMVRAMKMVSVSKLRRAQTALSGVRAYQDQLRGFLPDAREALRGGPPALMRGGGSGTCCYVLITGGRGLCGTYNAELAEYMREKLLGREGAAFVVCGRWGCENLALDAPADALFPAVGELPTSVQCGEIASFVTEGFLSGRYSEVRLVYQAFANVLTRRIADTGFLPAAEEAEASSNTATAIFEPDADTVYRDLMERYLRTELHAAVLSAKTAEHSARMTAMSAASDNADEMRRGLTLKLNRLRQNAVTTEMLELAGGAAAMRGGT